MLQKTVRSVFLMAVSISGMVIFQYKTILPGAELLERDLKRKKDDFKQLLSDYVKAIDELDSTKIDIENGKNFSSGLQNRIETLGLRLSDLETELGKKESILSTEKSLKEKHLQQAKDLRIELDTVKDQRAKEIVKLSEENNRLIVELNSERDRLKNEIDDLTKRMDENTLLCQNKELCQRQEKLENDLKLASKQTQVLSSHILKVKNGLKAQHDAEKVVLNSKLSKIESQLSKKEADLKALNETIDQLRDKNNELGTKMAKINDQNRELKSSSTTLTLNFLQDRVAIEQATKEKLDQVKKLAYLKVKKIEPKLAELEAERGNLLVRLDDAEAEKKSLALQLDQLKKKFENKKIASREVVEKLFDKLKAEQLKYASKLSQIKATVEDKIALKNEKISDFGKKTELMMADLIDQKRKFSAVFQELKIAQATLEGIREAKLSSEKPTKEEIKERKASELLAKNIEKLDSQILSMRDNERALVKQLELAQTETDLLKESINQLYDSNETLTSKNEALKSKLESSENNLLSLKDQARELTKREAELVDRVVNLELQFASGVKFEDEKVSEQLDQRLNLAKADYAKLREEVETLVEKLGKSNKLADSLRSEAVESRDQILALNKELEQRDAKVVEFKSKVQSLLSSLGLQGDLLSQDKKVEYLRLVADYNLEKLTESVLKTGKGRLDESLKVLINDDHLASKMVKRTENSHQQLSSANIEGNFGKIFSQLKKNQIKAELSKLYGFFLARASNGKGDDEAFRSYKKLSAQYFSDPSLMEVEIRHLSDPTNPLILKLEI